MNFLLQGIHLFVYPGMVFIIAAGMLCSGIHRKLAARMQNRLGPPVWQPFLDAAKLFGKESIKPEQTKQGFTLWPVVALASILIAGVMTPIAGITGLELTGSFIVLIYFLVLTALAIYLAGLSSANPYGTVGSMRGLMQMAGYEFPLIVSMVVPVVFLNTLSVSAINAYQLQTGLPWLGMVFPLAALAYFVSVLAKTEMPPFHVPDAHQELVSGYSTEYSGFRLAIIEIARMAKLFVLIALGVALFLGGSAPGIPGFAIFVIKSLAVLAVLTAARVLFARVRIEHVVRFTWLIGLVALVDLARAML